MDNQSQSTRKSCSGFSLATALYAEIMSLAIGKWTYVLVPLLIMVN